jgi:hypothetical protein
MRKSGYIKQRWNKRKGCMVYYAQYYLHRRCHYQRFFKREDAQDFIDRVYRDNAPAVKVKEVREELKSWSCRPNLGKCCICDLRITDPHIERRPTGKDGKMQSWAYCDPHYAMFVERSTPIKPLTVGERVGQADNVA